MRVATIDLGTNSTRLLVADVDASGALTEVTSRSVVTRLGEGVDRTGALGAPGMERVLAVVADYRALMDELEVETGIGLLTSAGRDAANGTSFAARISNDLGLRTRVLTGDEEATLTFSGATSGNAVCGKVVVLDVGGGSTEIAVGADGVLESHQSLQLGVVRQTERFLSSDPPCAEQVRALRSEAGALLRAAVPVHAGDTTLAVGGTPVSCQAMLGSPTITRADCEELLGDLAVLPLAERMSVPGLHPDRAPAIVAGLAIHLELLTAIGASAFTVCDRDLRHGAALALL